MNYITIYIYVCARVFLYIYIYSPFNYLFMILFIYLFMFVTLIKKGIKLKKYVSVHLPEMKKMVYIEYPRGIQSFFSILEDAFF